MVFDKLNYGNIYSDYKVLESSAHCNLIVCSMFTPTNDEKYFKLADRLISSCKKYSLPYAVYKVSNVHTSINLDGTDSPLYTKSNFILFNMERFQDKNILYVDVDMIFMDYPQIILEIDNSETDFAIYNWLNDVHNEAYMPIVQNIGGRTTFSEFYVYSHSIDYFSTEQLICSGGVQFYRNDPKAKRLLRIWQEVIERNPMVADDECLDFAFNNLSDEDEKISVRWLDKSYLRLPWWPHVRPVILHPSIPFAGGHRVSFPPDNERKRFYPEKCEKKTVPYYFPIDCIVDTKRHLLLKVKDLSIIDIRKIQQEFWIYEEYLNQ